MFPYNPNAPQVQIGAAPALLGADEVARLIGWYNIVGAARPPFGAGGYGALGHGAYGGMPGAGLYGHPGSQMSPWGHQAPAWGHPGGGYAGAAAGFPPRNALTPMAGPTRADRILLPMSSASTLTGSATITARPQNIAYRPERIIIGGNPGNWNLTDIKVGNRSQFSQAGTINGITFANNSIDTFVSFETVQTAMDFVIQVTYVGTVSGGEQFLATVFGTAAI